MTTAVVITGGDRVPESALAGLLPASFVVAADSGLDHAEQLGVVPDLVVGDFDSVTDDALQRFGGPVDRHPVAKDATDLELALRAAVDSAPERIVVVGGHGGRLDHFLANALVLTTVPTGIEVEWRAGHASIHLVRRRCRLEGTVGATVSLIPVNGDAVGVDTVGLRWPLAGATLGFGTTLGVSNEFSAAVVDISIETGTLFVVVPETRR